MNEASSPGAEDPEETAIGLSSDGYGLDPLLIIGAARSGTKFLRDLIGASRECRTVPYDVNYVWRYGNEDHPHDQIPPSLFREEIGAYVRATLKKMAEPRDRAARYLVEKSVPNSLRVPFVLRVFPEARFIHIVRDGKDVVESAYRQWSSGTDWRHLFRKAKTFPPQHYRYAAWYAVNLLKKVVGQWSEPSLWGPRYAGIAEDARALSLSEVCAQQWKHCVELATTALQQVDQDRILELRYEDLIAGESSISAIVDFLDLQDPNRVFEHYLSTVRRDTGGRWSDTFSSEQRQDVLTIIEPTLKLFDYA